MANFNKEGLTDREVLQARESAGYNEIRRKEQKSKLEILIDVFKDPIILIMLLAVLISFFVGQREGDYNEAIVISVLIIINVVISYIQEVQTIEKLEALNELNEDMVTTIRNGISTRVVARDLVPGDLVKLKIGDIARADMDIVEANNLQVDESFLTGESIDVNKKVDDEIFSNSAIKNGQGLAVVRRIGMDTKIGAIAKQVDEVQEVKSQLEIKILDITKILLVIAVIVALMIGILTYLNQYDIGTILTNTISILIATVPEGLATVLTIVLTFMSQKMAKNKALVKKVELLETLGEVEYVCSDKTGTITENKMQVTDVEYIEETPFTTAVLKMVIDQETPTSKAIYDYIRPLTTDVLVKRIDFIPFNSTIKKSASLLETDDGRRFIVVVGAPDFLVTNIEEKVPAIKEFTDKGLRTLGVMYQETEVDNLEVFSLEDAVDEDLIAIYGIQDPPKLSAIEAVRKLHSAKIKTVMITGDSLATARSIAKQAGIISSSSDLSLTGDELNSMSDKEFDKVVENVKVYARVRPEDKYRIVSRLQEKGKIVAMTGDGTNDSIALRRANVGIAMGIQGTDISKESADLILLDDNYATINVAVEGGRLIFDNLRKFIRQMLTSNAAHTGSILFALLVGMFTSGTIILPMTAVLILWVNVVSDAIPCLALGLDVPEKDLMERPPIDPDAKLLTPSMILEIGIRGLGIGLLVYLTFTYFLNNGYSETYARTMGFVVLSFGQLIHIFDARSFKTIYRKNIFESKTIWIAVIISALLNLLLIYSPLQTVFGLEAITPLDLLIGILISSVMTFGISLLKLLGQRIYETREAKKV